MDTTHALVISVPADAIALTPYLLGFEPSNSLVVIGGGASGDSFAFRWDLVPAAQHEQIVKQLYGMLIRNRADWVILLGYGSAEAAVPLLRLVQDALESILTVKDVLRIEDGRWWSVTCTVPTCCPPEGTVIDSATTVTAAQAIYAGLTASASREEAVAALDAVDGDDLLWMRAETHRAEQELLGRAYEWLEIALELIGLSRRLTDREAARLSVALAHLRVRDEAIARLTETTAVRQFELWRDLTRRAVGRYAAGPAALLAIAALLRGDGFLASVAVERCRAADPRYQLIRVIEELLAGNANPDQVRQRFSKVPGGLASNFRDR